MQFSEMMFYAEAEGLLPTRAGKINAVINDIKDHPSPKISFDEFNEILHDHGLKYTDLSDKDLRYIEARIS